MDIILQIAQPHIAQPCGVSGMGLHGLSDFGRFLDTGALDRSALPYGVTRPDPETLSGGTPLVVGHEPHVFPQPPACAGAVQRDTSDAGGARPVHLVAEDSVPMTRVQHDTRAVHESLDTADMLQPVSASPDVHVRGLRIMDSALSEGARATRGEGAQMDHAPAAQPQGRFVPTQETAHRPPWPALGAEKQPLHMVPLATETGGVVGGQTALSDLMREQAHEWTVMDTVSRDDAMARAADQRTDALGQGKGKLPTVPQPVRQQALHMPDRNDAALRSLSIDPDDAVAERSTAGQGHVPRPEQSARLAEFAGLPITAVSGAAPVPGSRAATGMILSQLSDPDQISGQPLSHAGPLRADGAMGAQGGSSPVLTAPAPVGLQIAEVIRQTDQRVVQIQLAPAELGRVRITLAASELGMHVIIASERTDTLDLLRRNASELMRDLAELGYEGLSLSFANDEQRPDRQYQSPQALATSDVIAESGPTVSGPAAHAYVDTTGMDLRM